MKTTTPGVKPFPTDEAKGRVIPETMKAAAINRFGPPEVLSVHTFPVPDPGPGEVLIELHAAGVGVWDSSVRDGSWRPSGRPRFPLVLGTDGAGIVVGKGSRVRRFNIGDRVWSYHYANPKGGFYAEYIAVDTAHVGNMPRILDFKQAGAAATTALTALQGIDDALRLRPGETVLVFGATGAVGSLAVQFAKRLEARVLGTASGSDATALLQKLGADGVFDARNENAIERLRRLAPDGLDAVLALAGSDTLQRCLDLLRENGRVAYPNGVWPEPRNRRKIPVIAYDAQSGPRELARLDQAVTQAGLIVPIAQEFTLEQAAKAHKRLERGHVLGRIVLRIRQERGPEFP